MGSALSAFDAYGHADTPEKIAQDIRTELASLKRDYTTVRIEYETLRATLKREKTALARLTRGTAGYQQLTQKIQPEIREFMQKQARINTITQQMRTLTSDVELLQSQASMDKTAALKERMQPHIASLVTAAERSRTAIDASRETQTKLMDAQLKTQEALANAVKHTDDYHMKMGKASAADIDVAQRLDELLSADALDEDPLAAMAWPTATSLATAPVAQRDAQLLKTDY